MCETSISTTVFFILYSLTHLCISGNSSVYLFFFITIRISVFKIVSRLTGSVHSYVYYYNILTIKQLISRKIISSKIINNNNS